MSPADPLRAMVQRAEALRHATPGDDAWGEVYALAARLDEARCPQRDARAAAVARLAELGTQASADALMIAAQTDPDASVRADAEAALDALLSTHPIVWQQIAERLHHPSRRLAWLKRGARLGLIDAVRVALQHAQTDPVVLRRLNWLTRWWHQRALRKLAARLPAQDPR